MSLPTAAAEDREVLELTERYGPAFAKALAIFVKELSNRSEIRSRASAVEAPELPEKLQREAEAEIERNGRLRAAGELEAIEFTDDSPAIGLANRLRTVIRERRMSQKELAARLGVSPSFVSKVLRDPERSKIATLQRIAEALGTTLRQVV
jgi:DNA-binding Xre family transcriptional regulator